MFILTSYMESSSEIILQKDFYVDYVNDDVTAWRQICSSIFMFKLNCHVFRDTGRSF